VSVFTSALSFRIRFFIMLLRVIFAIKCLVPLGFLGDEYACDCAC
jgi:hypothetical protein